MIVRYYLLLLLSLACIPCSLCSQTLTDSLAAPTDSLSSILKKSSPAKTNGKWQISGRVLDFTTAEPVSYATIRVSGSSIGTRADADGLFALEFSSWPGDSLRISAVGYATLQLPVNPESNQQNLRIELERSTRQMQDMVIRVSRDPALSLVKKVIAHRSQNNYDRASNYRYEVYNKLELDISKIPPKAFKSSLLLKKFDFIKQYIDSNSAEKPFLPLFLTETISDYYYQSQPKKMKEHIKGSRISGYKNQSVSQMLGSMYQNINVYENMIPVFNVQFVSPIARDAPFFYKYHLTDTQQFNGKTCYHVAFQPKRSGEHTFTGDMWIHADDFAIQKINMIVTRDQQINWVNRVTLLQEFTCLEDTLWFLTKDKFYVDFLPPHGEKVAGFMGRKTTTYKNIIINDPYTTSVLNDRHQKGSMTMEEEALNRKEDYWNMARHDTLSRNERAIYQMIDTIQQLPVYKKYYNLFYFLSTGIREVGPLEIGPIYNLYSRNAVEGSRFRVNLGTTPKLFKNIYLQTYLAYGTRDERWKYYASALWLLQRKPRMYLFAEYKHDVDNTVNVYDNAPALDNAFNTLGRKPGVPWKLAFVSRQRLEFFKRWYNGFSMQMSGERKVFTPYEPLPFIAAVAGGDKQTNQQVISTELGLELRFAYREQFLEGNYYVTSLGTQYPRIKLYFGQGLRILQGQVPYTRLRLTISDDQSLRHLGNLHYTLFAGRIWGTLPYSLLEVHPGNEFYYYNARLFSMMNRYEYISDQFAGLILEHGLGSAFFKYIPVIKKTRIRAFWNTKAVYGTLSEANRLLNLNQGYPFQVLNRGPYVEVGTGLENIFRFLRLDAVWRVWPQTALYDTPARRFGLFGSVKFAF